MVFSLLQVKSINILTLALQQMLMIWPLFKVAPSLLRWEHRCPLLLTPAAKFDLLNPSDFLKGTTPSSVANINHLPCKLALDTDKQKRSIVDSSAPAAPTGSLPSNKPSTQQGKNIGINKPESHGKEKVIMTINGNGGFPALLQPILPMDSSNISVS
ncbi:hypothetical protein M9H77_02099 [Catharanthus roseus]|uniref:Uncharacterized protein n=1 Tax=Catharanthus roseus TaxID=4058 RepID=A0ACC0C7F5_CATRO|nr:hypothetical protein M9H77_02099 [Catharanthus roseus]